MLNLFDSVLFILSKKVQNILFDAIFGSFYQRKRLEQKVFLLIEGAYTVYDACKIVW